MIQIRPRSIRMLAILLPALLVLGMFGLAQGVQAVEFEDDGVIAADEVIDDDVFISSDTIIVDGTVNGNLIGTGGQIFVNGNVNGDVIISGGHATIQGRVNGNVGFTGGELRIGGSVRGSLFFLGSSMVLEPSGMVGRNLFFNGFSLETQPESLIRQDVLVSGFQGLLAGQVGRDVQAEVAALQLDGVIGRDVKAKVSEPGTDSFPVGLSWPNMPPPVDTGLRVAEDADIGGTLLYISSAEQAEAIRSAPGGGVVYQAPEEPVERTDFAWVAGQWMLTRMRDLITLLVIGALVMWRVPAVLSRAADRARTKPLASAGWGLAVLIGGSVGALVLVVVILIVGIMLGVITLGDLSLATLGIGFSGLTLALVLFWLLGAYGSKLIVSYLVGDWLLRRALPRYASSPVWVLGVGILLYILVRSIPVLGGLFGLVATLVGLGAGWVLFQEMRRKEVGG